MLNEDQPWVWLWSVSDTYIFNRKVGIPHIPVPASNPKTISEVPFLNIVGNPYPWYNRIEEWTVKA